MGVLHKHAAVLRKVHYGLNYQIVANKVSTHFRK